MAAKDNTGFETLQVSSKAGSFNRWMFKTIRPFCHGQILEIGSGLGNISKFFLEEGTAITLSDTDNFYIQKLKDEFPAAKVLSINLEHPDFSNEYKKLLNEYDTVFLLNVLEHINHDDEAIKNCHQLLKTGGSLIILTPAYPSFYSKMDKELHHFRRYRRKELAAKVLNNGFMIKKIFHFNVLGAAGWLYGKILGFKKIPSGEMKIFNRLTWLAKFLDKLLMNSLGLSIVVIAEKK